MFRLLKCEFKKFRSTYINSLSFVGMLLPVALVALMFLVKKSDFVKHGNYNWKEFYSQLSLFFIFLVGPIITSFISVFSVFYEYQEKTMKNVLSSPHGRSKIILVKMIYTSMYVLLQYIVVALVSISCGFLLGFSMKPGACMDCINAFLTAGLSTLVMIPLMMLVTLMFRSFIPALLLTVVGTISNVLTLNWDKSYLSPWAIPANFSFIFGSHEKINFLYPLVSACIYFAAFILFTLIYFQVSDQNA